MKRGDHIQTPSELRLRSKLPRENMKMKIVKWSMLSVQNMKIKYFLSENKHLLPQGYNGKKIISDKMDKLQTLPEKAEGETFA